MTQIASAEMDIKTYTPPFLNLCLKSLIELHYMVLLIGMG